ncbi:hypothetical protein OROHE_004681 [Orobanche hederae]
MERITEIFSHLLTFFLISFKDECGGDAYAMCGHTKKDRLRNEVIREKVRAAPVDVP